MFYAALDKNTALAETTYGNRDKKFSEATIATFELTEDLLVLNLVKLPPVPSIFDGDEANFDRPTLLFLYDFVRDFTQPVEKDGREHVEYVPSQVVTEYVRYRLVEKVGQPVQGILYGSARTTEGTGCVLFLKHGDFMENSLFRTPPTAPLRLLESVQEVLELN